MELAFLTPLLKDGASDGKVRFGSVQPRVLQNLEPNFWFRTGDISNLNQNQWFWFKMVRFRFGGG